MSGLFHLCHSDKEMWCVYICDKDMELYTGIITDLVHRMS